MHGVKEKSKVGEAIACGGKKKTGNRPSAPIADKEVSSDSREKPGGSDFGFAKTQHAKRADARKSKQRTPPNRQEEPRTNQGLDDKACLYS